MDKLNEKACVFAGSFDPITKGHVEIIKKCSEIFDKVYVGVLKNEAKQYFLTDDEREFCAKTSLCGLKNVVVERFDGLLVDFMKNHGVTTYVRGIRNEQDYLYETKMYNINKKLYPNLTMLYLQCDEEFADISSSAVKQLLRQNKDISQFVEQSIIPILEKRLKETD